MFATKIGEKTSNILTCLFFKILWKTFRNQYLFVPLFSRNVLRIYTDQRMYKFFLLCLKSNNIQTFNCSSCKKPFFQRIFYWYKLPRWLFFVLFDNWNTLFLIKICYPGIFFFWSCSCFFETSILKEVRIYIISLTTVQY